MRLMSQLKSLNGYAICKLSAASVLGLTLVSLSTACAAHPLSMDAGDQGAAATPPAAAPVAFHPVGVWIACDDRTRVAYRVVPPTLNPHVAFTHPIKVKLRPSESCQDLK